MKDQCYEFIKNEIGKANIVGFGSYGEVKIARNTESNQIVAIKLIHGKNAKQQIDVHHNLNHPNIIKLLNYYYQKDRNITYMVLEYAQNGSLNQKIKFGLGQLSKQLIRKYFKNICLAIKYLHKNNYMHRDIKPQNILITKDNIAKLCDFGFAAIFQARTTMCGTFQYMAPQMIKKKHYNYKIDIWALGILLFQMIQGLAPFRGETGQEVLAEMKRPIKFSQRFDSLEIDLIKKILRVNAENRPSVDEILQHTYFKQIKDQQNNFTHVKPFILLSGNKNTSPQVHNKLQTSIREKISSSKQEMKQVFKSPQNKSHPLQVSQANKPKSPVYNNHGLIKTQPVLPNFVQNFQLNKSFKAKDSLSAKNQHSNNNNVNQRQSRKYSSNNVGLHSPQNQKKTLSPINSKTQTKEVKINEFFTKPPQQKVFTSNWTVKNNLISQKPKNVNKTKTEEIDSGNKKTSITGKIVDQTTATGSSSFRFLNKSFKDLKTIDTIQQQKHINAKTYVKTQPQSQSTLIGSANVRKNVNMSISAVNSSFNQSNARVPGQYQSPNSSFNNFPQSYQQNVGMKTHGSGEYNFSPPQMINFQKPLVGNISSQKQLNMSMFKEGFKQ